MATKVLAATSRICQDGLPMALRIIGLYFVICSSGGGARRNMSSTKNIASENAFDPGIVVKEDLEESNNRDNKSSKPG